MKLLNKTTYIYGFEDYKIVSCWQNILTCNNYYYMPYNVERSPGMYMINANLPVKAHTKPVSSWQDMVGFEHNVCYDHKELLDTAKKVYVHPSCKLSRSLLATKYKKSLNPWAADAVVIPKPETYEMFLGNYLLFLNESAKVIVMIDKGNLSDNDYRKPQEGERLGSIVSATLDDQRSHYYNMEDVKDATFFYEGELLYIPNTYSYYQDILTNVIPTNKIVYEQTIMESLGDETNKLDFDSLTSIKDMLGSSDGNTVAAGLKSLSMMDWVHYPNSVRYIMNQADRYYWMYNDAADSTSVKYMLRTLSDSTNRRRWPGSYDEEIYPEDYELFKKLKAHYENINEDAILNEIKFMNFMFVDSENILQPRLRK